MPALEVINAQGTAIGATIAALAASSGDSLAVRNTGNANPARILQAWTDVQAAGTARLRGSKFHDNVQGVRLDTIIGDIRPLFPWGASQPVFPNDVIVAELGGSATAGDIESIGLLLYYPELPGSSATLMDADAVMGRAGNIFTVENTLATTTAGGWSGAEAINVEFDQFHAGSRYALIGYLVDTECTSVAWRGADTANLRVGGPGEETERELTADWFLRLSRAFKLPLVPVFSAENKGGITVEAVQDENGADVTVTSIFVELSK
jgi:hypothetical protein